MFFNPNQTLLYVTSNLPNIKIGFRVKSVVCFLGCLSPLRNWILISPGYPNRYPKNMHCVYKVPIPYGMAMFFYFSFFEVQDGSSCQ